MGWKTLVIKEYDQLSLKNNNLLVRKKDEKLEKPVSLCLDELNCVLLENNYVFFSTQVMNKLIDNDIAVIFTNDKHDPNVVLLPLASHCLPLANLELQLKVMNQLKKSLWTMVVGSKLQNQIAVLRICQINDDIINKCEKLYDSMQPNDPTNHEGIVAKVYFRGLYGSSFLRFNNDTINSALNYGYKILASCLSRTLVKYGFNLYLGIHHKGKANPFNLTYDLIEPYRPVVDQWIFQHWDELDFNQGLKYINRLNLIKLLNSHIMIDNKLTTINSSFTIMVRSFISALKDKSAAKLKLPKIIEDDHSEIEISD